MNAFVAKLNNHFNSEFVQGSFGDELSKGDVVVFHDGYMSVNWYQINEVDGEKAYARDGDGEDDAVYEFPVKFEDQCTIGKFCEDRKNERGIIFKRV